MNNNYMEGFIASLMITNEYQKLMNYSDMGLDYSEEYASEIERIKHLVTIEDSYYAKLNLEETNSYLSDYPISDSPSVLEERYYNKLLDRRKILLDEPRIDDFTLFSSVIESKIMIDTFKLLNQKLAAIIKNDDVDSDFKEDLLTYHKLSKYDCFTTNNYLEKLALSYGFNISRIPKIEFETIEKEFNIKFIEESKSIFIYYVIEGLEFLIYNKTNDDELAKYNELIELTRLEVLISYLNKQDLIKLYDTINKEFGSMENNQYITTIKKLIRTKKEGLK